MSFQSAVNIKQGFGVPGEFFTDAPWKAETFTIDSANAAYNIIGSTCCSVTAQGICKAGAPADALAFAGFLVSPKEIALYGTAGQPLSPTLTVPNKIIVQCLTMGSMVVKLPAAATIGDKVVFDNTTGAISTISRAPFQLSGTLTSGNDTIAMADTTGIVAGQPVSGTGIPLGATVVSIVPNTSIDISDNATASGAQALTFIPSGNDLPAGTTFANAVVDYFTADAVGSQLAVIAVNPVFVLPA